MSKHRKNIIMRKVNKISKYFLPSVLGLSMSLVLIAPVKSRSATKVATSLSVQELLESTILHQERSAIAAENVVLRHPHLFPHLKNNLNFLRAYYPLHDWVKWMDRAQRAHYGDYDPRSIIERLHKFVHIRREDMRGSMAVEFDTLRDLFNGIEAQMKEDFFRANKVDPTGPLVSEMTTLEIIVDVTDTGLFRRSEMGIPPGPNIYNGAKFLREKFRLSEKWIQLSMELEKNYISYLTTPTHCLRALAQ